MVLSSAPWKFQTIANKVMRMSTILQADQHVHKDIMFLNKHLMGQGTYQ